ncbi:MAG: hypothetical protein ACREF9_13455, partial [Opitutaceae bacterium]
MRLAAALALLIASLPVTKVYADAPSLLVHEWGTFTSFQDSRGTTIPGINVDDELVPEFVHRLAEVPVFTTRSPPASWSQGAPKCHPDVTMRLETPVLYFYPKQAFLAKQSIDVRATFVGGWLTEYFPTAVVESSGFPKSLNSASAGSLQWNGLRLHSNVSDQLPQTTAKVWLAPRAVQSAVVTSIGSQESEKYLFYRGVGNVDAPLVVREQSNTLTISLRDGQDRLESLPPLWIVRVLPDGRVAYRSVRSSEGRTVTVSIPGDDAAGLNRLDSLRTELAAALVSQGLFEDEAQAMLATWQLSYFESEGLRLFFVLPATWTDAHLPLTISPLAETTRVMLGRIELVSAYQRTMLGKLLRLSDSALDLTPLYVESRTVSSLMLEGGKSHSELYWAVGRDVPEALRYYEALGRFRDALLAHESRSTLDLATKG